MHNSARERARFYATKTFFDDKQVWRHSLSTAHFLSLKNIFLRTQTSTFSLRIRVRVYSLFDFKLNFRKEKGALFSYRMRVLRVFRLPLLIMRVEAFYFIRVEIIHHVIYIPYRYHMNIRITLVVLSENLNTKIYLLIHTIYTNTI
jgi:hypothetical protein